MNQKRVNKWALISLIIGIILSAIGMYLIHSAYSDFFEQLHWLFALVIAIPWVVFIMCLFVMLFADKN
ncbi:hypothetical protein L3V86_05410 [Thiotrichales bacterium 19S11-10]|nr:hypothetical protein [Thiotrichales bacterium 19S11-10]MCF6807842.1 hypothetical protein [Thiotrichales bacterium 19S9-11]MCF6811856.1 hypothetical protein [Thiotrichales bacterium 19S9-12]